MELQDLYEELEAVKMIAITIEKTQAADHAMLLDHDRTLRGNGAPGLQESVRSLAKMLDEFIIEVREERNKRIVGEETEKVRKREEINKLKWMLLSFGTPLIAAVIYQSFIFWTQVAPAIKELTDLIK
jgi:hypothetical protein